MFMSRKLLAALFDRSRGSLPRRTAPDASATPREPTRIPGADDRRLAAGYRAMAADAGREAEACEWVEGLVGDAAP